jgi:hypothetical protein
MANSSYLKHSVARSPEMYQSKIEVYIKQKNINCAPNMAAAYQLPAMNYGPSTMNY